jgi:uncharacterized cupredoxin-like copper-binding protein
MTHTKLTLTTMLAVIASAISLVAVAQSATAAQTVRVTETSYSIKLSAKPKAGTVKFVIRNASDDGHDFFLRGAGKTLRTRALGEGGTATLTAKLKKGVRYTYWCSIGDHREEGMVGSFVAR